jgi:hypothetical protein
MWDVDLKKKCKGTQMGSRWRGQWEKREGRGENVIKCTVRAREQVIRRPFKVTTEIKVGEGKVTEGD